MQVDLSIEMVSILGDDVVFSNSYKFGLALGQSRKRRCRRLS